MTRISVAALVVAAWAAAVRARETRRAGAGRLDGAWKLNREQSQFPRDLGFGMDGSAAADDDHRSGRTRRRRLER
jgi:hypothetical protein